MQEKKSMKHKTFLLLTSFLIFALNGLSFSKSPEPDAVYLNMVKEYRLNEDGSWQYHYSYQLKLLTYFAFSRHYGETFIVYDTTHQQLRVNRSVTTMADGKKVPSPENAYNKVLPKFAKDAPAYNSLREMVITHTGLEKNALIDLDYEINTQPGFLPAFMGNEILATDSPIKELVVRIRLPKSESLNYRLFNSKVEPKVSEKSDHTVYEWKFTDLPQIPEEEFQPPLGDFAPHLVFSHLPDFKSALKTILAKDAFDYALNEKMKTVVEDIQVESLTEMELIMSLQSLVARGIGTLDIPVHKIGYRCRTPQETWQSNAGTLLEKSVLFSAFLKEAGISAFPILVAHSRMIAKDVSALQPFQDAIVRIEREDGNALYLPVDQVSRQSLEYRLAGKTFLKLGQVKNSIEKFPETTAQENGTVLKATLKVSDNSSITGQVNLKLSGANHPFLALQKDNQNIQKTFTKNFKGGEIEEVNLLQLDKDICSAEAKVGIKNPFKKQGDYLFWNLPENANGLMSWQLPQFPATRYSPLELPHPGHEKQELILSLSPEFKFVAPNINLTEENEIGKVQIQFLQEDSQLIVKRNITIEKSYITKENYPYLRELLNLWNTPNYRQVIFSKVAG